MGFKYIECSVYLVVYNRINKYFEFFLLFFIVMMKILKISYIFDFDKRIIKSFI